MQKDDVKTSLEEAAMTLEQYESENPSTMWGGCLYGMFLASGNQEIFNVPLSTTDDNEIYIDNTEKCRTLGQAAAHELFLHAWYLFDGENFWHGNSTLDSEVKKIEDAANDK